MFHSSRTHSMEPMNVHQVVSDAMFHISEKHAARASLSDGCSGALDPRSVLTMEIIERRVRAKLHGRRDRIASFHHI